MAPRPTLKKVSSFFGASHGQYIVPHVCCVFCEIDETRPVNGCNSNILNELHVPQVPGTSVGQAGQRRSKDPGNLLTCKDYVDLAEISVLRIVAIIQDFYLFLFCGNHLIS